MSKLVLLTISLILAVSCSSKAPKLEAPVNRAIPIWTTDDKGNTQVHSWRWDEYYSGNKMTTDNAVARDMYPICVDLKTYNKGEAYGKSLAKYVKYLEDELAKCKSRKK